MSHETPRIGSAEINKVIREHLSPALREQGFQKVNTRHNWKFNEHNIWVIDVTAVGSYFSDVTGWPSMSVFVECGIYYPFLNTGDFDVKIGKKGESLPRVHHCYLRLSLDSTLDQSAYTQTLKNQAERSRKDLWWIEPDGSNVDDVVMNIRDVVLNQAIPWFEKYVDWSLVMEQFKNNHSPSFFQELKGKIDHYRHT
ncbi:hypothetical protein A6395_08790 [Exiguobacterium sp. SH31]|uniref:DUF4304 domain-containing protein n=1 Tax=Exiguobacterium sp. SH31 TaxID=1843183 RepID=UPI0008D830F0|nr:DUF4304 domain-containing protein [Exiguobacterium sp. SH31]OGX79083.1 hypothetical protein A6395_08790 [Exiguobacterium sp. SH31]